MSHFLQVNILDRIKRFLALPESSGIVLLIAFVFALLFANTGLSSFYQSILHWPLSIQMGDFQFKLSFHHLVNDGLMAIFFFVVGLEIKQELVIGSLSSRKKAFLPFIAAIGGMVVPAVIYFYFNTSLPSVVGWGIPMATDIAFALGLLAFASNRIPLSLKIFLLALATIDDLGAVLVIASFYSSNISVFWLVSSGLLVLTIFILQKLSVYRYFVYVIFGVALWFCVLKSGIHATIAGVILGLMTPVHPLRKKKSIDSNIKEQLSNDSLTTIQIENVQKNLDTLQSPTQFLMNHLHHWVGFVIMPIFAFANGGVVLGDSFVWSDFVSSPVSQGIFLGLFLGKPIGVFVFSWIAIKLNLAQWPQGVKPFHVLGVGFLAGIGFTMALFISSLSLYFDPVLENYSKGSIFIASFLAGLIGFCILFFYGKNKESV